MSDINENSNDKGIEVISQGDDTNNSYHDLSKPLQRFSLKKVTLISLFISLFMGSVLINFFSWMSEPPPPTTGSPFHWIVFLGLIIVTAISLTISFWTYYVRSVYLKDGPALVPEKWGLIIRKLIDFSNVHHSESQILLAKVQQSQNEQSKKSSDLLESFLTMQEALNTKDEEISRLKKGHDAKVFKRFLRRFIRVDRSVREMVLETSNPENQKNYKYIERIMNDALEECGVEQFTPVLGSDYRDAGPQIADDPTTIETKNANEHYNIAKVEAVGYILKGEGEIDVIVPSKVSIFLFSDKEEK